MKFAIVAEVATIILAGALMLSTVAKAEPSNRECWSMANTVKAALASHPNASQEARDHYQTGTEACTKGYNKLGIAQFEQAMKAIGG